MHPVAALLAFLLLALLPACGLLAGGIAWSAFRRPVPDWRLVRTAVVILITPYVLIGLMSLEGLVMAFFILNPLFAISPIVGVSIAVATYRWKKRNSPIRPPMPLPFAVRDEDK
jgi:hypothetical protein